MPHARMRVGFAMSSLSIHSENLQSLYTPHPNSPRCHMKEESGLSILMPAPRSKCAFRARPFVIKATSLPCFTVRFCFAVRFRSPQGSFVDRTRVRKLRCLALDMELHGGARWIMRCDPRCRACTQASQRASTSAGLRKSVPHVYTSLGFDVRTPLNATASVRTPLPASCSSKRTSVMASKPSSPGDSGGRGRSAHHLIPERALLSCGYFCRGSHPLDCQSRGVIRLSEPLGRWNRPKLFVFLAFLALLAFAFPFRFRFASCWGCMGMRVLEAYGAEIAIDRGVCLEAKFASVGPLSRARIGATVIRAKAPA